MKIIFGIVLVLFISNNLNAQDNGFHPSYELQGTVSYSNSTERMSTWSLNKEKIIIRPTIGYFLSDFLELLFDIQYSYSYQKYSDRFGNDQYGEIHLGYSLGVSYNFNIRAKNVIPFIGTRFGQTWSRSENIGILEKTKWGVPENAFPDLFMGTRILLNKNWSLVVSIEYLKIKPSADLPYYYDENESTLFNIGFSVFL